MKYDLGTSLVRHKKYIYYKNDLLLLQIDMNTYADHMDWNKIGPSAIANIRSLKHGNPLKGIISIVS